MMRLAPLVVLLAGCNSSHDDGRGGPPPWDIATTAARDAKRDADLAELSRKTDALDRKLKHDLDDRVTDRVATLAKGWNLVKVSDGALTDLWGVYADGPEVLVAGHDAWMARSTDGGASWKRVAVGPLAEPDGSERHPLISEITGSGDHRVVIGFENHLIGVSADRGATWHKVALSPPAKAGADAPEPVEPGELWSAGRDVYITVETPILSDTSAIFVSHDFGETWKLAIHLDHLELREGFGEISGTRDGSEVYVAALVKGHSVMYRSRDRGATWQHSPLPATIAGVGALAVAGPGDLYAHFELPDRGDTAVRNHSIVHSRDGGATWTDLPVAFRGPAEEITGDNWWEPWRLFVGPDHTIYVSIHGRATMQLESSRDGGKTWSSERDASVKTMAFANGAAYFVGDRATVGIRRP